jgi:hypothetical protein
MKESKTANSSEMFLEHEAARLLRCSKASVKRLRLDRKLGYYLGRPVLIGREDLEKYVASAKVMRVQIPEEPGYALLPVTSEVRPFKLMTRAEAARFFRRAPATIKNWCLFGKVPFLPGKPARVEEKDISDFIFAERYRPDARTQPEPGSPEFAAKEREELTAKIHERVRVKRLQRRAPRVLSKRTPGRRGGAQ